MALQMRIARHSAEPEPHRFSRPEDLPADRGPWRVGVLSNPLSGANRRRGLAAMERCLVDHPEVPHRRVRSVPEVQAALEEVRGRNLNVIVVNSGDGTSQAALSVLRGQRLFAAPPLLALLSGGTTNLTHQALGLAGPPADALRPPGPARG